MFAVRVSGRRVRPDTTRTAHFYLISYKQTAFPSIDGPSPKLFLLQGPAAKLENLAAHLATFERFSDSDFAITDYSVLDAGDVLDAVPMWQSAEKVYQQIERILAAPLW